MILLKKVWGYAHQIPTPETGTWYQHYEQHPKVKGLFDVNAPQ